MTITIEGVSNDRLSGPYWAQIDGSECHNLQTARQVLSRMQADEPQRRFRIKRLDATGVMYFYGL